MISVVSTCNSNGIARVPGADAGFRVRGGASGVSRISARGVLMVSSHTKSGGGGVGGSPLQVRYTRSGGGGGGGSLVPRLLFPQLRMDYITATWKE